MFKTRLAARIISVVMMSAAAGLACGQSYPSKTIRIITTATGGGSDFAARMIAQGISAPLGQPVVVDNRGSGALAAEAVSKSPPDGYTLFIGGSPLWISPLLQTVPYVLADFAPICLISMEESVLAVHPSLPVKSVKELIALAKARPGELNYSSAATGGPGHLAAELFKSMTGVKIVRVAYKSGAQTVNALISGEVQVTFAAAGAAAPFIKSGRLKVMAVTGVDPSALAPGVPTMAASGVPGYEFVNMTGIFALVKTPQPVINRLSQEIVRLLSMSEMKTRFLNSGTEVVASSPEQFAAKIKADVERMGKIIKESGIKVD